MLHLREMGCKVVDWVHLAQIKIHWYAFVNMIIVIVLNVSYTYFIFGEKLLQSFFVLFFLQAE